MLDVKKFISLLMILALLLVTACASYQYEGAAGGGAVGGIAGALLDHRNPWRGGLIGAALGAAFGATLADVSVRGSRQAAQAGQVVQYRTDDGRGVYRAEPTGYDAQTRCTKVHERVWENGNLVKDQIKEVCEGEKFERTY